MSTVITDVRCPVGANTLLMRVLSEDHAPVEFVGQTLQVHCKECSRDFRKLSTNDSVQRVLHVYTLSGEFIHTQIQFRDGAEKTIDLDTQVEILKLSTRFMRPRP